MIGAVLLVALNAGTTSNVPYQSVVVAHADLKPRLPIDAASLAIKRIPVAANYPSVFFTKVTEVQGMIPLVTILSGEAITSNVVVQASQALGSQSEYLPIPSGFVALTIPTSERQDCLDDDLHQPARHPCRYERLERHVIGRHEPDRGCDPMPG